MRRRNAEMISFKQLGDQRGHLVVIEGSKDIPFEIARVFYIYGSDKNIVRGQHANRNSEFVLVNVQGTSKVKVDYGNHQEVFELSEPHTALFIPKMVWKEMYAFSQDSILLVFSNQKYDANEYIRNHDLYLEAVSLKESL